MRSLLTLLIFTTSKSDTDLGLLNITSVNRATKVRGRFYKTKPFDNWYLTHRTKTYILQ